VSRLPAAAEGGHAASSPVLRPGVLRVHGQAIAAPSAEEKLTKGTPPSGRWYAQFEKDHRGGGSGKPWEPGERERLLQTPFTSEELARRRANGEDPDAA